MKPFLEETAKNILHTTTSLKTTTCIVPSERAGMHLKNCFKNRLIGKATFLPKIISIENFIKEIARLESADTISLLFEFYNVYQQEFKREKPDSFERFMGWATVAIQDFNEIDRHLVPAKKLFQQLTAIQNIKDWSPSKDQETPTIKNYWSFVKDLEIYYQEFKKTLIKKGIGYQGLIYREAYQKHVSYLQENKHKTYYFIGFNAFNKAEEEIVKSFLSEEKNHIYWDVDAYYYHGTHEAGKFLRNYQKEWGYLQKHPVSNSVKNCFLQPKSIHVLGAPLHVTGIKAAASLLKNKIEANKTAFVLAEESLLPVVLNSLPNNVTKANITMGYSLQNAPLFGLFQSLFELHLNKLKLKKDAYYYKEVISLLRHPYLGKVTQAKNQNIIQQITQNNWVFVTEDNLVTLMKKNHLDASILKLICSSINISEFLNAILHFTAYLHQNLEGIDLLYIHGYRKVFQEIIQLNNTYQQIHHIKVLYKMFLKILPLETVDFKGEALEGLQLMGLLETRCLDFKNVILTSVNEGVIPTGKKERSFISYEVKKEFGIPTFLDKDAVFSYHFYRLLQRAENVYFVYNTNTDAFGGGEMSRFLTQLSMDKKLKIVHTNVVTPLQSPVKTARKINKTPEVMRSLLAYFQKGISPSRIVDYVNDPLEFYHKIVLKIKETDAVEEEVASNTLGNVVHDSLENLYTPYLNKILLIQDVQQMQALAKKEVANNFKKHFKDGDVTQGKNKLIYEVANRFVLNFLTTELNQIKSGKEVVVTCLEKEYTSTFVTPKGHTFILKGKVDRQDQVDGVTRIVDYKTGKVENKDLKLKDWGLLTTDYNYHKALQVMTYVLLFTQETNINLDAMEVQAGIYSFKNLNAGFLAMNFAEAPRKQERKVTQEHLANFKESLLLLMDEILDVDQPFLENLDRKYKKEV